jgi:hypothetical protein
MYTIDPSVVPYIQEFIEEMSARGAIPPGMQIPYIVSYAKIKGDYIGICYPGVGGGFVVLDTAIRDTKNEYLRKSTIFHEISHCSLQILGSRGHSDNPNSIMYWRHNPSPQWTWEQQLDELALFIIERSPYFIAERRLQKEIFGE